MAAIKGEKTLAVWRGSTTFTATRSRHGRLRCLTGQPRCSVAEPAPPVDLKMLHAEIDDLTLENDFLAGALSKSAC